jgi:hypothetical protein
VSSATAASLIRWITAGVIHFAAEGIARDSAQTVAFDELFD